MYPRGPRRMLISMPSRTARWFALVLALLASLYLCWLLLQPFVDVVLWAAVLVAVFQPVHRRIRARIASPSLAAALSTALVVATIFVPATFVTIAVVGELSDLAKALGSGDAQWASIERVLQTLERWMPSAVDLRHIDSRQFLMERLQTWSGPLANRTLGMVEGVVSAIVQVFFVIFTMFYVFRDLTAIRDAAYHVVPLERTQAHAVITRTQEVIAASVYGKLVITAIQGALGGVMFWLLGLHSPLLWGVVMFFLSMIPMAGSFLVWGPAAVFLAVSGAWVKSIVLTAWGVLVIGTIDNVLTPRLVGKRARLHELLTFFSVLGGLNFFGVLGIVLGPVTVAVTLALFDVVRQIDLRTPSGPERPDVV